MWETFFLKSHTQNVLEKLFPDLFLKNQNLAYFWINCLKFYAICFYCMPSWRLSKYIENKLQTTCFYLLRSFFKRQKGVWNWSLCLIFCMIFEEKYFSCSILLTDQIFLSGSLYFVGQYVYCNCLLTCFPLGKITSRWRPEDFPKKRPDVLRMSPYGPIYNTKGRIFSGTSLGRTEDVNLTIIHEMSF